MQFQVAGGADNRDVSENALSPRKRGEMLSAAKQ